MIKVRNSVTDRMIERGMMEMHMMNMIPVIWCIVRRESEIEIERELGTPTGTGGTATLAWRFLPAAHGSMENRFYTYNIRIKVVQLRPLRPLFELTGLENQRNMDVINYKQRILSKEYTFVKEIGSIV